MAKTSNSGKASSSHRHGRATRRQPRGWGGWRVAGISGLVVIAAIIGVVLFTQQTADIPGVQTYSNLGYSHTTAPVTYAQVPPVGGDHNPVWLNCGIYDQPVPNESAVHSLEHGAVWVTYQPSLSPTDVDKLRGLVRGHAFVILSPYPNLPTPVVASGWGIQLQVPNANDSRLPRFIAKYEQGPQTREMGGVCTGGLGNPLP